jgi:phosphoribosylformimino-5-aminoimidazole carboxamide ribonucleotide (ProFAR) isomerase
MRVGATIILLNGYCFQSYNWNKMRPLGKLQGVIDSLESYQCDEISILRPIRESDTIESFKQDVNILKKISCMTPISFGGGLREIKHIDLLHDLPIERLIFSSAFIHKNISLLEHARKLFGHQAIQCLLPFVIEKNVIKIFFSEFNHFIQLSEIDFDFINKYANEVIFLDTKNEGMYDQFEEIIYKMNLVKNEKLIISGGIGKTNIKHGKQQRIASILIDNKVLHKEYSIKDYKHASKV